MFIARLQEFPFTVVVSETVFCQGMVVLLNPVCGFLSGMLYVLQFLTSKTLSSIRRLKIVELFGPIFLKPREARRKEAFHTTTDFTLLHVANLNSN